MDSTRYSTWSIISLSDADQNESKVKVNAVLTGVFVATVTLQTDAATEQDDEEEEDDGDDDKDEPEFGAGPDHRTGSGCNRQHQHGSYKQSKKNIQDHSTIGETELFNNISTHPGIYSDRDAAARQ